MYRVFNHQYLQMIRLKLTNTTNFHPLEVVSRGSDTQRQVGENLRKINWRIKG